MEMVELPLKEKVTLKERRGNNASTWLMNLLTSSSRRSKSLTINPVIKRLRPQEHPPSRIPRPRHHNTLSRSDRLPRSLLHSPLHHHRRAHPSQRRHLTRSQTRPLPQKNER
jgi:hypothetical protein